MKFVREDSLNSGVPGIKTGYIFESECVAHIDVPSHIVVFFTLEPKPSANAHDGILIVIRHSKQKL